MATTDLKNISPPVEEDLSARYLDEKSLELSKELLDQFLYLGFDPKAMRKFLIKEGFTIADIEVIVILTFTIGANVEKWNDQTIAGPIIALFAKGLIGKGIQRNKAASKTVAPGKMLITAPRVLLSFPDVVVAVLVKNPKLREAIKGITIKGLPLAYHWPGAISVIPENKRKDVHHLYMTWALTFDYQTRVEKSQVKEKSNWDFEEALERVMRFAGVQQNTKYDERVLEKLYDEASKSMGSSDPSDVLKNIGQTSMGMADFLSQFGLKYSDVKIKKTTLSKYEKASKDEKS